MNHAFNVDIATELKHLEKAVLLENIMFWVHKNETNKRNYHNGKYWTQNSYEAFGKQFPYMNARSIKKWMGELERDGWVLSYQEPGYDRAKFYTLTDKYSDTINKKRATNSDSSLGHNMSGGKDTKCPNDKTENVSSTYTDIKQDINTDTPPAPKGESKSISIDSLTEDQKQQWQRFKQVCQDNNISIIFELEKPLTPRDLFALKEKYRPDEILATIKDLQNYKPAKKRYISANLTLQKWLKKSA